MFEQSFVDFGRGKGSRLGSQVTSFIVQGCLLVFLILLPLIFTDALPRQEFMSMLVAPPPPPPPPPPPAAAAPVKPVKVETEIDNGKLKTPTKIPDQIKMVKDEEDPSTMAGAGVGVVGGIPGGVPGGQMGGVLGGIISSAPAPVPKIAAPQRIRVSGGVAEGKLVHRVQPVYPPLARTARIQGQVILQAIISKTGEITGLKVIQGHPMLQGAALEAVKQWRYEPYLLNGEPVEVDTTITVNFTLGGG
ncbi:MAG: energy transducer TonB [Terriglobales bacterium]|jgi:protein TonB